MDTHHIHVYFILYIMYHFYISSKYIAKYVDDTHGQNRLQYVDRIVMIQIYDVKVFLEKHSICLRHDGSQSTYGARA